MAYEIRFIATDDADWAEAVELIDDTTNLPLADATDAEFDLSVMDCGTVVLSASTEDGTAGHPEPNVFSWRFTPEQLGSLCVGTTYKVGAVMTTTGDRKTQLIIGTLAFTEGGLA